MDFLRSNVLHFRDQLGLIEADLAKAAGVSQPTINRFLNSEIVDLKTGPAAGLAARFGVSLDDLLWHDFRTGPAPEKKSQADLDHEALASSLVSLDKAMQALNISYRSVQRAAPVLAYAYKVLSRSPNMPNSERAMFDELLIAKLREVTNAAAPGPGPRPAAGHRGRAKSAKA